MKSILFNGKQFTLIHETDLEDDLDLIFVCRQYFVTEIVRMKFFAPDELKNERMLLTDSDLGLVEIPAEKEESLTTAR